MYRSIAVLFVSTVVGVSSHGAVTNYVNSGDTDPDVLSDVYVGEVGNNAATVSGITSLTVQGSEFTGGSAGLVSSSSGAASVGYAGLALSDIDGTKISGDSTATGGDGGNLTITTSGTRVGTATGGNGVSYSPTDNTQILTIDNVTAVGGTGGDLVGLAANELTSQGGSAVYADLGSLVLNAGEFRGGDGGSAEAVGAEGVHSFGGHGIDVNYSFVDLNTLSDSITAIGGNGGSAISANGNLSQADGGNGLNLRWQLGVIDGSKPVDITGGNYTGGNGGFAVGNTNSTANGGNGFVMEGGQSVNITGGTFTGGAGGIVTNSGTAGYGEADGGAGAKITFANINIFGEGAAKAEISGGTFNGGVAGTVNNVAGEEGYGLILESSDSVISGSTIVNGRGLLVDSFGIAANTLIEGGTFSGATFTSLVNADYPAFPAAINTFTIEGGNFGFVNLEGIAGNDGTITGGSIDELHLSGSALNDLKIGGSSEIGQLTIWEGTSELSISNGVKLNGPVAMYNSTNNVNLWNDSHFSDLTISNSTVTFKNQDFIMDSGSSLSMLDQASVVYFERNAEVNGSIDVNLGSFTVESNLLVNSGSEITSAIEVSGTGIAGGVIEVGSALIEDDVTWTVVNTDTNMTRDNLADGILLISAGTTNLDHSLQFADLTLENNPEWLLGINGLTNVMEGGRYNLYATYGQLSLEKVFEDYADLEAAMAQLGPIVIADSDLSDYVAATWTDIDGAAADMTEGFVRTPEMANALIGLQGVFADQFKERTRSNLRYKNFGSSTTYTPTGAAGPSEWYDNTVQWMDDHLPKWDAKGAARKAADSAPMPNIEGEPAAVGKAYNSSSAGRTGGYEEFQDELRTRTPGAEPIEVPESYQLWGRGYGSHASQDDTDGHSGYGTTIAGGVVGFDKRFEQMLIGLGGGYARTKVEGNGGNDGDADTVHIMGYWAHNSESFYMDAMVNYAYNDVSTESVSTTGYESDYDAHSVGLSLGIGYGISFLKDKWLLTPEASYLGTYYSRGSYTETSSLSTPFPDKKYDSYDQWSHLTSVGATLSTIGVIESFKTELEFQPEIRVHWLHEFNADMDADSYLMQGGTGDPIMVALQAREEDLIRLGAGVRFSEWGNDTTEFGLDVDGAIGQDYHNIIVSGKFLHRF